MPRWPSIRQHSSTTPQTSASDMAIDSAKAARAMNDDEKENNNEGHTNGIGDSAVYGDKVISIAPIDDSDNSTPTKASNGVHQKLAGHYDADIDMGQSSGSKEGGGRSGRRKQSKPARVFLDVDSMETEQGDATAKAAEVPAAVAAEAVSHDPDNGAIKDMDMEVDDMITCDLCNDTFPTQSALTEHIQSSHTLSQEENPQPMEMYPTKYHRLGSELQQEAVFPSPKAVKLDLQQPPPADSPPSRTSSNGSESQNGSSKSRIFHQDAYCKLCDREFCNKYFLKIHMANKHGVYEEGMGVAANGNQTAPAGSTSEYHTSAPNPASQAVSSQEVAAAPPSQPPAQPQPPPVAAVTTTPIPASKPVNPSSNSKAPSNGGSSQKTGSTKTSPDMEDYCEICQKHFCNKYYLRKHKHDVHGIVPEAGLSSGSKKGRGSSNSNSSSSSMGGLNLPPATSTGPNPLLLPQSNSIISTAATGASSLPGLNSMANVMFINPFAPPVAILQAQPVLQTGTPAFPPPPPLPNLSAVPQPPSSSSSESPKTSSSASSSSPSSRTESILPPGDPMRNLTKTSSAQLPNDALRSIGILNADAYCEICRKEFCNKYFLSIHKANKHGIYMDETSGPLILPGLTPGLPENLSLRGATGPELGETTPLKGPLPDKLDMKIKSEGPGTTEEICEICKKEFNNKFSLKIHLVNAHNIKPQDFDLGLELFKSEKMNGGQNLQGTMFSNMIAAKLADRVTCDICNKEVCNKYFLKTHKMKVHGLDPVEIERMERENENKCTPTKAATPATGSATSPAEAAKEVLQRPNDEELLKMGIDPEAYCEICRKEFCSKYFLKTHKANIHGIKSDSSTSIPLSMPMAAIPSLPSMPSISSMAKFTEQSLMRPQLPFGLPQPAATMVPLPGALPLLPGTIPDHRSSPDSDSSKSGSKWMWKEPINQTRVMCEICNKELCNKYFLKTHLLKKHGIYYDVATGQTSGPSSQGQGVPNRMIDSKDGDSSNDTPMGSSAPTPQPTPTPPQDTTNKETPKGDTPPEDMADGANTVVSAKTWSVPQERGEKPDLSKASEELLKTTDGEFNVQKCELCGMMFGEKVTLQFHMIRDHQGQVVVRPPGEEDRANQVALTTKVCATLKRKYQRRKAARGLIKRLRGSSVGSIGEKVKYAIVNHIKNHMGKKKFRCAHCQERFLTRSQCQAHIRTVHDHEAGKKNPLLAAMPGNTIPYNGGQKMQGDQGLHSMQAFNLEEQGAEASSGHFPTDSVVYLPVLQQISQPITATFTLTPAQQP